MIDKNVPKLRFKEFKNEWNMKKIGSILAYEQPTKYIVKSTNYSNEFNIPVLTAGKSFLLGYTDEDSVKKASKEHPVIIFDDFTTSTHFVDFSFKVKSSAMKILSAKNVNTYFAYCTLLNMKYVPTSHSRHWISMFQKMNVMIPSEQEQIKISTFLSKLDYLIKLHSQKLEYLRQLKRGYIQKMFPQEYETVPRLRFKGFSEDWKKIKLGDILAYEQPTKYIVKSTNYSDEFNIPVLTAGKSFLLGYTDEDSVKKASKEHPVIIFDDFTTSTHFVDFSFKVKSSAMKILSAKNVNTYFAYCTLLNIKYVPTSHSRHWISMFQKMNVMIPSEQEQIKISTFLRKIDSLICLQDKKIKENQLKKKAYLQKMFI